MYTMKKRIETTGTMADRLAKDFGIKYTREGGA